MHRSAGLRAAAVLSCWLALCAVAAGARAADAPSFGHAAIVQRDGEPTLELDGKPVFFWGAAFFYERLPASRWRASMLELRELGVTTLDLYVPWNWHELSDGAFDFDGHTNPRRNLREVLRLGRELGFTFIVRPGPVIRNEWRNGGYPAWLLTRPEYGMPLHDVLEGRYPATATLQNARSDDAAAEWMRNETHLRYASRWLHRALAEFRPVADRVLAVQLDDDQGAYIDNQTYPAPHLQAYLRWLDAQARDVIGPVTPTFINTYEMRVPASSPVWTMGNWYQSDAYTIGEHDRTALDVATAMLRTNRRGPLAVSEFQAGWLAQPEDPQPRPADPTNTTLALYELLGWGVHGIVDFPMQDTLAPFGWEAPFSNALYAWDAALRYPSETPAGGQNVIPAYFPYLSAATVAAEAPRYAATWSFGFDVHLWGPVLAQTHRVADVALVYPGSAYPGDPVRSSAALSRFRDDLRACTVRGTACDAVDLRYATAATLRPYGTVVVDDDRTRRQRRSLLASFERRGGRVLTAVPAEGAPGSILDGPDGTFLVGVNWSNARRSSRARMLRLGGRTFALPPFAIAPRSATLIPIDVKLARVDPRFRSDLRIATTCAIVIHDSHLFVTAKDRCIFHAGPRPIAFEQVNAGTEFALNFDGTLSRAGVLFASGLRYEVNDDLAALSPDALVTLAGLPTSSGTGSETHRTDVFEEGTPAVVLQNAAARVVIVPAGGARVPVFELMPQVGDGITFHANAFDATGALRDDALLQPPLSPTDRIARYTHSYPAGTFNREYAVSDAHDGSVRLETDVPDAVPAGARFERAVTLMPGTARLIVDERARFADGPDCERQRAVVSSAFATAPDAHGIAQRRLAGGSAAIGVRADLPAPNGVALVQRIGAGRGPEQLVVAVSWRPGDVESASWTPQRSNGTLRLVLAPGWRRVTYAMARVASTAAADAFVEAERAWVAANPARISEDGEVAKRYTQSPQKRPSESSCGFESHLPQ